MAPRNQNYSKGKGLRMAVSEKDILLKISQATSRISNLEQLLKTSVKICAQAMGVDRCSIWLTDEKKKYAEIKAVYVKGRFRPTHLRTRIDIKKFPVFRRIISEGKVIHSPDISKMAVNRSEKKFLTEARIKSALSVPLKIKNKVLGALNLGTLKNYKTFTPSEIRLCQIIANQMAVGIENTRFYKELENRTARLQEQSIKVLKESEQKYRTLLENLPQLIFLKDKNSVYVSANENYCRSLGIKPEGIRGKTDFDFFPKELAQKYRKDDRDIIKTGKTKEIIEDYIEKGKREIVQTVKTPVLGDDGKPIGVLGIFWDITERRRTEKALKASEKKYRTLVETAQEGIGITDPDEKIIFVNEAFARLLSYKKEKLLGLNLKKITHQSELAKFRKETKKRRKGESSRYETKLYTKTGKPRYFSIAATPIYDDKGTFAGTMGLLTDITERKRVEEALIRNERIARERARLLTDLRNLDEIDVILTRVCQAVCDSGLFRRAVMTTNRPGGEIIHLGQVGLPAAVIQRARKAPPVDPKLRARITTKRFRISDSFFVPVEAGMDFSKIGRYIPQKTTRSQDGNWQIGDELFVPLRDFSGRIMGYLSADTPVDGFRPDKKTIEALEMLVEAAASRIREVEAQKSVKKQRDFSQSIMETTNSLIVCLDADAKIIIFNQECERVTGYQREEVRGKLWPELFLPPDHRHHKLKSFASWVRAHPRDQYEGPIKTKKGEIRTILWSNTAILGHGEKDLIAIAIGQDITERKKTEEALQLSQERYKLSTEAAKVGVWDWDLKSNKFYVDPNVKAILGYKDKEIPNDIKVWTTYVHPDDLKPVMAAAQACIDGKTPKYVFEHRMMHKDGSIRWILSNGKVIRDKEGNAVRMIGTDTDVTERKMAEGSLRESEERFRTISTIAKDAILMIDNEGNISYWNPAAEEIFGYSSQEIIGKELHIVLAPEKYHEAYRRGFKLFKKTGQGAVVGKTLELDAVRKDGTEFPTELSLSTIKIKDQWHAVAIIRDITERKQTEDTLKESEERFRVMAETSPDYIFQTNIQGTTIYCSPAIEPLLGYTPEERQGKNFTSVILPSDLPKAKALFKKVTEGEIIQNVEINLLHKSGRTVPIEVSVVPTFKNKEVIGLFGIARDITERKQAEEALRESGERYRSLFEDSPISLWEEDFSEVKKHIDELRDSGVKDFRTYFESHPAAVSKCAAMVKVVDVNKASLKLFKARHKEELQQGLYQTFSEESFDAFREELIAIAEGKTMFESEAITKTLRGDKNRVVIRWAVAPGYKQTFSKVLVSIIDITELKKAEEALKESQKFLEEIIDHIPDPVFIKNRKHQWILLNKAITEMVGYSREEMLGKSDHDFFPKKQADFFWKKDEEMFRTGKIVDIPEEPITDAGGNVHWLHTKKAPLRDSSGKIATLVGIIRDITDQKKAVEALRKSKDLNTILQISYRMNQIFDLDKMLNLACQETAKALDVDRCAVVLLDEKESAGVIQAAYVKNHPRSSILGARLLVKDFPNLLKLYQRKERFLYAPVVEKAPLSRKEKDYFRKSNIKSFVIVPIDTGKRLLGTLLVGTMEKQRIFTESEITFVQTLANHLAIAVENVRLMEVVKGQAENLKILSKRVISAQEEERKRIAQELHDEIGQDLALMKINMEISKQRIPSELHQVIDRIKDNEKLTAETLEKVRNLTTDLRPPQLDDFGLVPTLKWYIDSFSKRTNIKVTLKCDQCRGRLPLDVEMVLYRIVQEALTNVAKHARATELTITLERKNNYALLTVKDNGIGFDLNRMKSEQKDRKRFGLFSIEERVKLLYGNFSITSKPKKGTRLHVRIPCPKGR